MPPRRPDPAAWANRAAEIAAPVSGGDGAVDVCGPRGGSGWTRGISGARRWRWLRRRRAKVRDASARRMKGGRRRLPGRAARKILRSGPRTGGPAQAELAATERPLRPTAETSARRVSRPHMPPEGVPSRRAPNLEAWDLPGARSSRGITGYPPRRGVLRDRRGVLRDDAETREQRKQWLAELSPGMLRDSL